MLIYLLKFSACLAIFLFFYRMVLERESMHSIKRYVLLASLVLSLGIPLVTFHHYIEPTSVNNTIITPTEQFITPFPIEAPPPTPTDYVPIILWSLYGFGVLIFGFKFIRNLSQIIRKINRHPNYKNRPFMYVLLEDLRVPHTFFNYIFLNRQNFEDNAIPKEVFWHEQAHANQKHSLDVMLIEMLQVAFWFHPLIYLSKRAIKLNHEFLADQAVLSKGIQPSIYQQILLTFSSNVKEPQLANAIYYSSIKKRFTVMKTHTSKRKIWLRSLLLLPLIALTLYGFSETKEVVKEKPSKIIQDITPILVVQQEPLVLKLNGKLTSLKDLSREFLNIIKGKTSDLTIESNEVIKMSLLDTISKLLKPNLSTMSIRSDLGITDDRPSYISNKYKGFEKNTPLLRFSDVMNAFCDNCTIDKSMLKTSTVVTSNEETVESFKVKFPSQKIISIEGNSFNNDAFRLVESLDSEGVIQIFDINTKNGIVDGQMIVSFKSNQQKATPEEVVEYNKLARYYNSQQPNKTIIKQKDLERMEYLYKKMSKEQQEHAEPYPNIVSLPSPPIPDDPKTLKGADVAPPPPTLKEITVIGQANPNSHENPDEVTATGKQTSTQLFRNDGLVVTGYAKPLSPIDHVRDMTKKGATFYYEGKIISSDEAINLLKKNEQLNISTTRTDSTEPQVHISKEPITVTPQTKSNELVMVNGKKLDDGMIEMTIEDLKNASFSFENSEMANFKFKIPGVKTESVTGNRLNGKTKALLETVKVGTAVQLFLIKDANNSVHPPLLILIKE